MLPYHLSDLPIRDGYGLARPADHTDPLSLQALRAFLTDTGCPVQVRPILDPATVTAVDRYEVPARMRAALAVRDIADVFPYGSLSTRIDIDHTAPYDDHGPPGQTDLAHLGPLGRAPHRDATIGRWRERHSTPALACDAAPTAGSGSSPTKAPSTLATPPTAEPSGTPPHNQHQQTSNRHQRNAAIGSGSDEHDPVGRNFGNSRNGVRAKTVLTEIGPVQIEMLP